MTVCLFGGSYRRRAEALKVEAEREIRKEKVGRRHLKKERNEMGRERERHPQRERERERKKG